MQLQILYDNNGKALAALPIDTTTQARVEFRPREGQGIAYFSVPDSLANKPLGEIMPTLSVDLQSKQVTING